MAELPNSIGARIRQIRKSRGVSMRTLAKRLKVKVAYIYDIEHGRRYPTDARISQVARTLHVSPQEILKYDTRPPKAALAKAAQQDPMFNLALRRLLQETVTSTELFEFLDQRGGGR